MAELDRHTADPAARLRPETVDAMRTAVARRIADPAAEDDLTAAFLLLCDDARRAQLPAEQLLQTLKAVWEGVPAVERLPPDLRRQQLADLATLCITRYYRQY